ncbi:MAG TPA: hypothetical protein ENJ35_03105, partial [Gammaproteobacteria bacterium]|nr:hypothetical protein [Gammaproteobacteria bacterium]
MLARFIKPKWKHKNPEVRRAAVARLSDQDILLDIANSDPDESVRKGAISRIDNLSTLLAVHTDPEIQLALNQRLIELLPDPIEESSQRDAIENYVRVRGGASLATTLALENPSVRVRTWVIPLLDDSESLEKMAATDSNANVRLKAAEQLQDEAAINRTLKQLGRKDKRVTQLLKQKLEKRQQQQKLHQTIEELIEAMESIGGSDHWQRDNTRFLSLKNQWSSLAGHSSDAQQTRFDAACAQAAERIQKQREAAAAHQPVIEQKESQCELIGDFIGHLEKRHRISAPEAEDVQSTLD